MTESDGRHDVAPAIDRQDRPTSSSRQFERRAARRLQNRTEILDAAERVFGRHGIHDGSLRKIAMESGFSPAAIYLFFDNRQHLLAETITRRTDELMEVVRNSTDWGVTPLDRLHRFIDVGIAFFGERPYFRLLLRQIRSGPTITEPVLLDRQDEVHGRYLDSMDLLATIIREGQALGEVRGGDPGAIAHLYMALIVEFILIGTTPGEGPGGTLSSEQFHGFVDGALRSPGP